MFRARIICRAFEICQFLYKEDKVLRLSMIKNRLQEYELTEKISLESLLAQTSQQIEPLVPLFDLQLKTELDYLQILEERNKELLRQADAAMYQAKKAGGNQTRFY